MGPFSVENWNGSQKAPSNGKVEALEEQVRSSPVSKHSFRDVISNNRSLSFPIINLPFFTGYTCERCKEQEISIERLISKETQNFAPGFRGAGWLEQADYSIKQEHHGSKPLFADAKGASKTLLNEFFFYVLSKVSSWQSMSELHVTTLNDVDPHDHLEST